MTLPTINAVWIGTRLGPVHSACLASFIRVGHRTVLHAFNKIEDVPQGVEMFDASQLMATHELLRYRQDRTIQSSSLALASDIYRLRIQRENLGIYVDCDMYCLKPFPDSEYLFGWAKKHVAAKDHKSINNAVLRVPPASELLRSMLDDAENPKFIPPWGSRRRKWELWARQILGTADTRAHLAWTALGPKLLTHHVERLGLQDLAMDIDVFYPLAFSHKCLLTDPELTLEDNITRRSIGLHLWSSAGMHDGIPPGSTLDKIVHNRAITAAGARGGLAVMPNGNAVTETTHSSGAPPPQHWRPLTAAKSAWPRCSVRPLSKHPRRSRCFSVAYISREALNTSSQHSSAYVN